MGKFTGLLLIVTGVGVAVYSIPSNEASGLPQTAAKFTLQDSELQPRAKLAAVQALPEPALELAAADAPRRYSSDRPMLLVEPKLAKRPDNAGDWSAGAVVLKLAKAKSWLWPWQTSVTVAPESNEPAAETPSDAQEPFAEPTVITVPSTIISPPPEYFTATRPGDDEARLSLARELQKELTRVGCFSGAINGVWDADSKAAMSAFLSRVNATLPVDDPDYILLTLIQGHSSQACARPCSRTDGLGEDGRCQPRSIRAAEPENATYVETATSLNWYATASDGGSRAQSPPPRTLAPIELPLRRPAETGAASRVDKNSSKIDSGPKRAAVSEGRLAVIAPPSNPLAEPLAIVTESQIRTPSASPTDNDAAKRAQEARRRAAARREALVRRLAAAKERAKERARERHLAAIATARTEKRAGQLRREAIDAARFDERRRAAEIAALAEARRLAAGNAGAAQQGALTRQRAAADAGRAGNSRRAAAARAAAINARNRSNARRRIARANAQRKSYLGAKKRRRAKQRRTFRRRRNTWKRKFWSEQGM